jgi:hypothetical protein
MNIDKSCGLYRWLLLAAALTRPCWAGEPGETQELPPEQRVLRDGLNPEYCLWRCKLIAPEGNPHDICVDDHPTQKYGQARDFADGSTANMDAFGPGVLDRKIADGVLSFTVGAKDAYLQWGDYFRNHPEYGEETIGSDAVARCVIIRLRQSLPSTKWAVGLGGRRTEFEVKGTQWQEAAPPCSLNRQTLATSLAIFPGGEGNRVEIDWIRVARRVAMRCFRKDFQLGFPVRRAEMAVAPHCGSGFAWMKAIRRSAILAIVSASGGSMCRTWRWWSGPTTPTAAFRWRSWKARVSGRAACGRCRTTALSAEQRG